MPHTDTTAASSMSAALAAAGYVAEPALVETLEMMALLARPLLLEGEAGVGKTRLAGALARASGAELIRLQCYEGLDVDTAVYEWNYPRQLLAIKLQETSSQSLQEKEEAIFGERYLLPRPLLKAISADTAPVLLIDEIDRADEAFEAYLLEVLSDYQVSIPEIGTVTARSIPAVVLTSNGTRELSDALRRRCLYYYLDYPDLAKELAILRTHLPDIDRVLARQIVAFVQQLREEDLRKRPGVAETLDWAAALAGQGRRELPGDIERLRNSLACLIKTREDQLQLDHTVMERALARARSA